MEVGANHGVVGRIVAVATIGGLLFGYDSGAVNGTQDGLRSAFTLSDAGLGFTVGSLLIGCFIGAFVAGNGGRAIFRPGHNQRGHRLRDTGNGFLHVIDHRHRRRLRLVGEKDVDLVVAKQLPEAFAVAVDAESIA